MEASQPPFEPTFLDISTTQNSIQKAYIQHFLSTLLSGEYVEKINIENILSSFLFEIELDNYDELYENLQKKGIRKVCQYQFRKNDIVWICRTCQTDETCVLCNDCFQDSSHDGHEVYFYHSQAGGCCDCGDAGAWKPEGFCTKHGQTIDDPLVGTPENIIKSGEFLLQEVVQYVIQYCQQYVKTFTLDSSLASANELYSLRLHNDDVHTIAEVISALNKIGMTHHAAQALATKVHEEGFETIGEPKHHSACLVEAKLLEEDGLFVSIVDSRERQRNNAILAVIRWLHRMAQTSDGMCRLISNAIVPEQIKQIMVTDPYLLKPVVIPLHTLLLTLMADQKFKICASRGYALAFAEVAAIYAEGKGTSQNSLFGLSVQFLNRYIYVEGMITQLNFFSTLSSSLVNLLVPRRNQFPNSKTLTHRRYYPIIGDLKVVFTLPFTSRFFCGVSFEDMLSIFSAYQFLHPQERQITHHIEFETTDWMVAFNLYIGISGLFDYFVNWFESLDSIESPISPITSTPLPTVFEHTLMVLTALWHWQLDFLKDHDCIQLPLLGCDSGSVILYPNQSKKSFHLYLHRYFATCIRESARFPHLTDTIDQIQNYILVESSANEMLLSSMLDFPLTVLVWESQIRAGLWRRNGGLMNDQIHNYGEPHFCRVFKDMDLLFVQIIGTLLDTTLFLNQIIYRFSLQKFLFGESLMEVGFDLISTHQLLEGMLLLLINAVTELPLPPFENAPDRIRIMLRREIVHFLISGPCPYSDLQNLMQICVPESERTNSSVLDDVISAVGDWQEGTPLEPSKVKLKEKSWLEYDSSFPHAVHRAHQKAHENRPKIKSAQPYAPQPPPSHPQFTCFRIAVLTHRTTWDIVRSTMISYLSVREKTSRSHDFTRYRQMNCPISVFTMSLHLLTLVIHSLFSSEGPYANLLGMDDKLLNQDTRKQIFAEYLNESIEDLSLLDSYTEDCKSPSFLDLLIDLFEYFSSGDDPIKHWIFWILSKITELSPQCDSVVGERLRQQLDEKRAQELLERRNRARERAMQSMKKSAAAFESHIGNEADDIIDEEEDTPTDGSILECIVCRSNHSTDTLGYIGYSQASKYLHHDPSPSLHMVSTPEISKVDLHVQFCGHCIHLHCFDTFIAAFLSKQIYQNDLIISPDRGQFQCPLCNKIGNFLLPIHNFERNEGLGEATGEVNWTDWILTDTERGTKRELSEESASREDIMDALNQEELGQEDDEDEEEDGKMGETSTPSLSQRLSSFLHRLSNPRASNMFDTFSGLGRTLRSLSEGDRQQQTSLSTSHQEFRLRKEIAQRSCFRFHFLHVSDFTFSRLMGEICEPILGKPSLVLRNNYFSIPEYLSLSLSSISYSVNIDRLESDYSGRKSSGMDIYQCMGVYVSAIGYCLEMWGVRQSLLYKLLVAIKGQYDSSVASWTRSILIASSSVSELEYDLLKTSWFDKPLLAMPLLDALALYLSASKFNFSHHNVDQPTSTSTSTPGPSTSLSSSFSLRHADSSAVKWICVAYLIQCFLSEIHELENQKPAASEEDEGEGESPPSPEDILPGWDVIPLFRVLYETILMKKYELIGEQSLWTTKLFLSRSSMERFYKKILLKWIVFLRIAIRMTKRCDLDLFYCLKWSDDAISIESLNENLTNETVNNALDFFQLKDIFTQSTTTSQQQHVSSSILSITNKWLHDLFQNGYEFSDSSYQDCLKYNQWHYPVHTTPSFVELPHSYTKLHGQITSRCSYEYPAFCFVCGEILDAGNIYPLSLPPSTPPPLPSPLLSLCSSHDRVGGKGQCTQHVKKCGGEVGIFFLLQDCTFLLLFTQRGSYFTSPYVDSRGEKHRTFRGKPLFLDQNILKLVYRLYLSHGIPKEVTQKRSMSQRVIINGHY